MFGQIRQWIEGHFVWFLIAGLLSALFVPGLEAAPSSWATYAMATIILFSCSKIHLDEIKQIPLIPASVFYVARFLILPLFGYFALSFLYPDLKEAVLLLLLVPCGVMVPAVCIMMGGNVSMGLGGVVLSSLLAPIVLPVYFEVLGYEGVDLNSFDMFVKLSIMILLPIAVYFGLLRRVETVKQFLRVNAPAYSVVMITVVFSCVIAKQRDVFFEQPGFVLLALCIAGTAFLVIYGFGWMFAFRENKGNRIAFALISGANNMALAIAVGILFFPDIVSQFLVVAEVIWIASLPVFRSFLKKVKKDA